MKQYIKRKVIYVQINYKNLLKIYKNPHVWVLKNVPPIDKDAYYEHKKGSVIWVKNENII